ncbi:hypothetical protein [Methanobacterium paludis]|uniref:Uncharacterized protein n=1 Tax=Methanobacterium paludis (strain DSM 25820 / JCM 18151 / SWAN1) TaxID=868131 RepID=F6D2R4_METPW|nr:hypothetical protein [Methanobacterium paludis]AEG18643.1 hypothetical protein MSWAN_1632 [Methanobacterium paludis]
MTKGKKTEEVKEQVSGTEEVKEQVQKKPEKELSDAEIDLQIRQLKQVKIKNHLKDEEKRIKEIKCPKCGKNLGLKPEDYMQKGSKATTIECPKCEQLIYTLVEYHDEPEQTSARMATKSKGYAWETQAPGIWKDKHTLRWAKEESEKLENNASRLTEENQKILRVQALILKELKLIK